MRGLQGSAVYARTCLARAQSVLGAGNALLDDPQLAADVRLSAQQLALGARELQLDDAHIARRALVAKRLKARQTL